jgi:hypothetical protein
MIKKSTVLGQRLRYRFGGKDLEGDVLGFRHLWGVRYIRVRFDGHKHNSLIHPKWNYEIIEKG